MRGVMTAAACMGAMLVAACSGLPGQPGGAGGSRFASLRAACDAATDYGADTQSVNATLYDAYVAYRHGRLAQADYCAFESDIARHYRMRASAGPDAQRAWAEYFNAQRAKAIDWRAAVDPTLRGG